MNPNQTLNLNKASLDMDKETPELKEFDEKSKEVESNDPTSSSNPTSPIVIPNASNPTPGPALGPRHLIKKKASKNEFSYNPASWFRILVYDLMLWFFSVVFDCFFREIRPRGAFRLPRSGPVIFVAAPHANQFVDPIILMNQVKRESSRRVSFLIAAKSYRHKIIGLLSKCQLSIPVVRAQDNLTKGTGKIFVDFDKDPLLVRGVGTKFLSECGPKGLIALPQSLGAGEIVDVLSDTELTLRKEFKSTEKLRTLLLAGTSFKRAWKVDQKHVYNMVFQHLSHGNCIGIFPEGGSHDRTDLLPLKAGVAIMALGAMDNDPNCNVKIVPCGMNYFHAHKFRSRAVVEFGHPIDIPKELVKKYANPETNREAVKDLLEIITTGLKAVTVTCEDYETLMVVHAARRLYAGNLALQLPLPLVVEMNRRLVLGYQTYRNEPEVERIKARILEYNKMLRQLYLPDHHVEDTDSLHKLRLVPIFIFRIVKLMFFFVLALPGATLFSPVFILAKVISTQKAKTALAASTVKIKANDVIATWKILIGMLYAPILYSFYACIATYYCYTHEILLLFRLVWLWCIVYGCGVLVTYSALITGEQGMDLLKSLRPIYLSITSGSSIKDLKKLRAELSEEITDLVNKFGPELFPNDFNLLEMKDSMNMNGVVYVDSDEEEDRKTEELRNRRAHRRRRERKERKEKEKEKDGEKDGEDKDSESSLKNSSSVSDGISLMNSDNSLTNIPMFSDYHLHANAKNPNLTLAQQSNFNSVMSMDDYHAQSPKRDDRHNGMVQLPRLSRSNSSEAIELNFKGRDDRIKLSDRIKSKIRRNREEEARKR